MHRVRVALANFWDGFGPDVLLRSYPFLEPRVEFVEDARAEVVISSCFANGKKIQPRLPLGRYVRVFLTHENLRPDPALWDFSFSFARDLDGAGATARRHFRLPNYVPVQWGAGFGADALLRDAAEDVSELRRGKDRFCVFLQANRVPFREGFVERLARYKPVDCAGPRLNNLGRTVPREEKHDFLARYKFVVAFENEATPGYTTEKLVDALLVRSVPLYWGDPEVDRDFSPEAFLWLRPGADVEEFVERIAAVDADDALYEELLRSPVYPVDQDNRLPPHADPVVVESMFDEVFESVPRLLSERAGLPGWGESRGPLGRLWALWPSRR